jgi:NADH-quinone oxidoreductase subunit L
MLSQQETLLITGAAIPLVCFFLLALFGSRMGKPAAGWFASAGITASTVLASIVLYQWFWLGRHDEGHTFLWSSIGDVPITVGVNLDALTVIMFFMVTFVSTCIFVFSIGYMAGHSDEIDGQSEYHRFFTFLSLFGFSMLGLVLSNSILFLFIFWELVGLCSYFLIGFYFHKKSASNAAIKAFVTNRVGDLGFLVGLMMVFLYLRDLSLAGAASAFREQYAAHGPLFANSFLGMSLATWMGMLLFCGAIGKSAQFPLHVWLPDAMEGPTPVSALIHAATMVAAGVYLVARIFVLLTPQAQSFVAVIGCITLALAALVAIVQTDIKKVLAYSTISQLGYMIFGLGVGAWIGALLHLLVHAYFKALMFLGSGQVIEGCHHEQDIRNMGGLIRKMPVTAITFFIGVLAIAGAGIPWLHLGEIRFGLGGFFSKDEILAVAYHRAFMMPRPISPILFWVPTLIAYITPFYMMRCWWLTFMGKPRNEHVYKHAHESPLMYIPLIVLAIGTIASTYVVFRPMVQQAAPAGFLVKTFNPLIHSLHGEEAAAAAGHHVPAGLPIAEEAHRHLTRIVGLAFVVGYAIAIAIYFRGLSLAAALATALKPLYVLLVKKFYFDELYGAVLVGGLMALKTVCNWIDVYIVDGIVNAVGWVVRALAMLAGDIFDRAGAATSPAPAEQETTGRGLGFLAVLVVAVSTTVLLADGLYRTAVWVLVAAWLVLGIDGIVNDLARGALQIADAVRRPQTGRIRNYVLFAAGSAAVVLTVMILL